MEGVRRPWWGLGGVFPATADTEHNGPYAAGVTRRARRPADRPVEAAARAPSAVRRSARAVPAGAPLAAALD
ncbi:hypothetical protein GCM10010357_33650 [Streptomyces luteireticuli]|uniref:Uncharacterized protein n=1 Tax=Streptomyces luteireticuli TaxID=173858 RepID=A0ABP3ILT1_9ACTN